MRQNKRPPRGAKRGRRSAHKAGGGAPSLDPHVLYQLAVQDAPSELDFLERAFLRLRGRRPVSLREDFCGTALICATWVKRRAGNTAIGVDLHAEPLSWGRAHNLAPLTPEQRRRVRLVQADVRSKAALRAGRIDAVMALNFSYWVLRKRQTMLEYFRSVRRALKPRGLFVLDFFGGPDVLRELTERTRQKGFTYVWEQAQYDPITGDYTCHIHFEPRHKRPIRRAFTYHWRLWTIPELRDILTEAGFKRVRTYWEGDDGKGGGNGIFRERARGEPCTAFVAYLVAE